MVASRNKTQGDIDENATSRGTLLLKLTYKRKIQEYHNFSMQLRHKDGNTNKHYILPHYFSQSPCQACLEPLLISSNLEGFGYPWEHFCYLQPVILPGEVSQSMPAEQPHSEKKILKLKLDNTSNLPQTLKDETKKENQNSNLLQLQHTNHSLVPTDQIGD